MKPLLDIFQEINLHEKNARMKELKRNEADFSPVTVVSSRIAQMPSNIKKSERLGEQKKEWQRKILKSQIPRPLLIIFYFPIEKK